MKHLILSLIVLVVYSCTGPTKKENSETKEEKQPAIITYFKSMAGQDPQAISPEHRQHFPDEGADLLISVYDRGSFVLVLYTLGVASSDLLYFVTYDVTNGKEIDRKVLDGYLELENLGDGVTFEVPLELGVVKISVGGDGKIMQD